MMYKTCQHLSCGTGLVLTESRSSGLCSRCRDKGRSLPTHEANTDTSRAPASSYADGNPKAAQGAKKYSLRHLPLPANVEVNRALEDGAKKYGPANWRETGVAATIYVDAALRHLMQWYDGKQDCASDSGVHNLGHAMACFAIIIDAQANGKLIDDRPTACVDTDAILKRPEV